MTTEIRSNSKTVILALKEVNRSLALWDAKIEGWKNDKDFDLRSLEKLGSDIKKKKAKQIVKSLFSADAVITIFDVGAHVGQSASYYKSIFKNSNIYSFEPFQNSFEMLKRVKLDFNNLGLSDEKGMESFNSNKGSPTNSLLKSKCKRWGDNEGLSHVEGVECEFTTLDDFCDENNVEFIDFLKIDVQGAEFRVLKGAHRALSKKRIGVIQLEVILVETYKVTEKPWLLYPIT